MRQTLRPTAAKIRPILRVFFASLIALSVFSSFAGAESNSSARRDTAKVQFDKAEKDRQALEARPENSRTLKDYSSLVAEYKRVYLISTRAADVPTSLNLVAELYRTMGDLFDEKYYQQSVNAYQFLLKQYPTTRYRETALLAIAHIEQDDLHDDALAQTSYEEFLTLHPNSSHAAEVRVILAKMKSSAAKAKLAARTSVAAAQPAPAGSAGPTENEKSERAQLKPAAAEKAPPATDTNSGLSSSSLAGSRGPANSGPRVSRIRTWNADTYTRIVIDVGDEVKYQAARISTPDRIYFDIEGAKLNPALLHKPIDVADGGFLQAVRVAQNQSGVVRVVLEVSHVKDYSVFLLPDPYRLVVDVYGTSAAAEEAARIGAPLPGPTVEPTPAKADKPVKTASAKTNSKAAEDKVAVKASSKAVPAVSTDLEIVRGEYTVAPPGAAQASSALVADIEPGPKKKPATKASANLAADAPTKRDAEKGSDASDPKALADGLARPADEETLHIAHPVTVKKSGRGGKSAHDQALEMGPPPTPELTRDGQTSLTRALGLKIGRIVIDAGHGGHDTGTIGPTGLMEKDLCLDVALRVGKLIQQRLPAADVVFTRDDDTFIPLQQRTEIANQAQADLFLSIHANSSQDQRARGIETYYLNFTGSSDAMEVASRENALSGNAVHDLQDIVSKIARNEKIEESRDFAGIIQDSLAKRIEGINKGERNRGVRKAPFVVLIGANMPSVLAEISFVSNPSDEQWLKKPENRQRIAEGLYRGIENYLQSTNSLANNQVHPAPGSHSGIVARSGNSQ